MKRHVIIGRFGKEDKVKIPVAKDEHATVLPLVKGENILNFGVSKTLQNLNRLKVYPGEIAIDLLILAAHVYAADTRISRVSESQDSWTREIRLIVPVSDLPKWNATIGQLTKMLNFLTGDRWSISFRKRPHTYESLAQKIPDDFKRSPFTGVSLFSGGLDSLIGAIDTLQKGQSPLLISHAGDGATSRPQEQCFAILKKHYKKIDFQRLRFWLNVSGDIFKDIKSENSTRARSFLFFSLGVVAGSGINQPFMLQVPENGLIALNVPLDTLRLGSLSTRTTHPYYMECWNVFLSTLGIAGRLENPYWNKTKGEMVQHCLNKKLLKKVFPLSMSCSSPTKGRWKHIGTEHCGYCLPCLIRRASIKNDTTKYTLERIDAQELNSLKPIGQQIRSFQIAAQRLAKNPGLSKILIHKPGPLPYEPKIVTELADVYSRGMKEVAKLLAKVKTKPG